MQIGQRVTVKLAGDDASYPGICIKARGEEWVQIEPADSPTGAVMIADHNNIDAWDPRTVPVNPA